jgi:hypothetical protein
LSDCQTSTSIIVTPMSATTVSAVSFSLTTTGPMKMISSAAATMPAKILNIISGFSV